MVSKILFTISILILLVSASHQKNNLNGPGNIVIRGEGNDVYGRDNILDGFYNGIKGNINYIKGSKNLIKGDGNLVQGDSNIVQGEGNVVQSGSIRSSLKKKINKGWNKVHGKKNKIKGQGNSVIGDGNVVEGFDKKEFAKEMKEMRKIIHKDLSFQRGKDKKKVFENMMDEGI